MTLLHPAPIPASRFTWDPKDRSFTAEASDLGPGPAFGRVWDDSCDEGLTLTRDGRPDAVCAVERTETDREGDVLYWTLKPVQRDLNFTVTVFND